MANREFSYFTRTDDHRRLVVKVIKYAPCELDCR